MSKLLLLDGQVNVTWDNKAPGVEATAKRKHIGSVWKANGGWWCESPFMDEYLGPYKDINHAKKDVENFFEAFLGSSSKEVKTRYGWKPLEEAKPAKKKAVNA